MSGSRIMRRRGDGWEGVEPRPYKDLPGSHRDVVRHLLAGGVVEPGSAVEDAATSGDPGGAPGAGTDLPFELRAFRVAPGGFTSYERHAHPHAVVVLEGAGSVRLGRGDGARVEDLAAGDALWIAPWEAHQLRAGPDRALVFLCVVARDRDRPRPVDDGNEPGPSGGPAGEPA